MMQTTNRLWARRLFVVILLVAAAGCSSSRAIPAEARPISGLEVLTPGMLVLFGDIHGTAEIPAFVADAACFLAQKQRQRVHVGLEIPASETPALRAFLATGDDHALRSGSFWTRSYQDGRSSEAVLGLLRTLRDARQSGLPVEIFFFDDPDRLGLDRRDEAMAENIAAERIRAPADIYLVEVGNLHAKSTIGAPWDPTRRWMASYLKAHEQGLLTLDVRAPRGTAWVCSGDKAESCGVIKTGMARDVPAGSAGRAVLLQSSDGYDGVYELERMTASRPAFAR
jgi:hypothetical protein